MLSVNGESKQLSLAQEIAEKNLSVRQAELLAKKMQKEPKSSPKGDNVPTLVKEIEIALSEMHGTPVKVSYKDGKGSLTITFNSDEQLKEISKLLEK